MKKVLVTGSCGLVGSEAVRFFSQKGFLVFGIDNNMRRYFFSEEGSTADMLPLLQETCSNFFFQETDIRDLSALEKIFAQHHFDLIVHTAAQPSHDWAAKEPLTDFSVNAQGTLYLLEMTRRFCPDAVFLTLSTNKVYGDKPNEIPMTEYATRYDLPENHEAYAGISEAMSIDQCTHSLFGVSKTAGDLLTQEYGKYFGIRTAVFRAGCITGGNHSGVKLHGFLSYLVKAITSGIPYTILGYEGKQVRDNIHAYDVVNALYQFYLAPKEGGAVYNLGGGRSSNTSILEAIQLIENETGKKANISYHPIPRVGDHRWYISDMTRFRNHYPDWKYAFKMTDIIKDLLQNQKMASLK